MSALTHLLLYGRSLQKVLGGSTLGCHAGNLYTLFSGFQNVLPHFLLGRHSSLACTNCVFALHVWNVGCNVKVLCKAQNCEACCHSITALVACTSDHYEECCQLCRLSDGQQWLAMSGRPCPRLHTFFFTVEPCKRCLVDRLLATMCTIRGGVDPLHTQRRIPG